MDGQFNVATWSGGTALLNQRVCRIEARETINQRYLRHFLPSALKKIEYVTPFVTVKHLSTNDIREIEIPLPPLQEQHRIALILDRAEALQGKRRQALAKLDTLAQFLFLEMFGDPALNGQNWPEFLLGDLFEEPPCYGTMIPGKSDGKWLVLRVANIQDWELDLSDKKFVDLPPSALARHSVRDGDILLARAIASESHLGKAVVASPGSHFWGFDSHLMRIRLRRDRILPDYLVAMLRTPGGRSLFLAVTRRSAVQYNVNTKEITGLRIPVPSLDLQEAFAEAAAKIAAQRRRQVVFARDCDSLFRCLQHAAFQGNT